MRWKRETAGKVMNLAAAKKAIERKKYSDLVLKVWDDWDHADKRELLDLKGETQIKARERL